MARILPDIQNYSVSLPYAVPHEEPTEAIRYLAFDAMQLHRAMNMGRDELETMVLAEDPRTMLSLLAGTVLYRHLERLEQMKVREAAEGLSNRRLLGRFRDLHIQLIAQPQWHAFSLSNQEIDAIMAMNRLISESMDDFVDPKDIVQSILTRTMSVGTGISLFAFALVFAAEQQNSQLGAEQKRRR